MKKVVLLLFIHHCCFLLSSGQAQKGQVDFAKISDPKEHYQTEFTFDETIDSTRWLREKSGLNVSFGSTDRLYFRTEVPELAETKEWTATGWRGERMNGLLLVWSPDTLLQVRLRCTDLKDSSGKVLSKKNIHLKIVRYVVSNYPYNDRGATCDVSPYKNGYLLPDRFEALEEFMVPARSVRPIWISLDIPADTEAGEYLGTIEVKSERYSVTLHFKTRVQKRLLPAPHQWKYRLDLWQNPWVVAWENHLIPWSLEHKALLKKHLALYAGAGGKYITTYAVQSPWADNSYWKEGTMIEWIKRKDGSWKFDYSIFDQYVQLAIGAGIDKAITIYTPIPWGDRFRYQDDKTGNYVFEVWHPGTVEFSKPWMAFLGDLQKHLQKKGWLEKTYLGINETTLEETIAAIKVIKSQSEKWKITYAGNWHRELDGLLNDYSFLYGKEPGLKEVKQRSLRGATSTYYVCCNPPKPNDFVFSPPVEGRWLSWYAMAHGYDGFLRWAYDAWPQDPTRDARHVIWPAGDCFLVYPGGNSCIRFEKLREGIVDYEKIRILKEIASRSSNKKISKLVSQLDDHLKSLLEENNFETGKITADMIKGKHLIETLSDDLLP